MKSVLLSITPKYCELIASGQKTVEIRKNRPKINVPFKVYIYENLSGGKGSGKVIGEFVCDYISAIPPIGLVDVVDCECSCLTPREIMQYANGKYVYAWHISDLVIYDKPKELSAFSRCRYTAIGNEYSTLMRPPRSWCYVE